MSTGLTESPPSFAPPPLSDAQQRLLDAAAAAFAELGFGGTTTRDIAAKAGRSPAAVYIHHATKEDLLFAVSIRGHQSALWCLSTAYEAVADPVERLRRMVHEFSLWHMDNAKLARVAQYELHAMTPEHRAEIVGLRRRFQQVTGSAIAEGVDRGDFAVDDVSGAADAVLSLSIDLVRWFDPERRRDRDAIARQHADLAVRMLRPCPTSDTHGAKHEEERS